jgi:hypothetical protein
MWLAEGAVQSLVDNLRPKWLPDDDRLQVLWDWLFVLALILAIVAGLLCRSRSEPRARRLGLWIPIGLDALASLVLLADLLDIGPAVPWNPAILALGLHLLATAGFGIYLIDLARTLAVSFQGKKAGRFAALVTVAGLVTVFTAFHGIGYEQILITAGAYVMLFFEASFILLLRREIRRPSAEEITPKQ